MGYNFVHKHQMKEFFSGQVFVRIAYKQYLLEHLYKKVDKQIPEFSLRKLQHRSSFTRYHELLFECFSIPSQTSSEVFLKFLNPLNTNIFISQKIHFTLHVIFTLRLNVNCSIIVPVTKRL